MGAVEGMAAARSEQERDNAAADEGAVAADDAEVIEASDALRVKVSPLDSPKSTRVVPSRSSGSCMHRSWFSPKHMVLGSEINVDVRLAPRFRIHNVACIGIPLLYIFKFMLTVSGLGGKPVSNSAAEGRTPVLSCSSPRKDRTDMDNEISDHWDAISSEVDTAPHQWIGF